MPYRTLPLHRLCLPGVSHTRGGRHAAQELQRAAHPRHRPGDLQKGLHLGLDETCVCRASTCRNLTSNLLDFYLLIALYFLCPKRRSSASTGPPTAWARRSPRAKVRVRRPVARRCSCARGCARAGAGMVEQPAAGRPRAASHPSAPPAPRPALPAPRPPAPSRLRFAVCGRPGARCV